MLAINRSLFCAGSKIIVTTRNMSSLTSIQVDSLYAPVELNVAESLKLFSWNAFKTDHPEEGYLELSQGVVAYSEGLPLALEVLGSSFASMKNKAEWECGLKKLRKHLPKDIHGKLKISFESLDKNDQDLFLDITFFFIGRDKDFAVKVLEGSECFPESGIGELARRCLIRVEYNKLKMHNLLREMAREIVYLESLKEPEKRSRLRGHEEVLQVLRDSIGRETIEGLYLELPELNKEEINVVAFANMCNLRLLHLNYLYHLRGTNLTIFRELKLLCWHGFPLTCIPDDLHMENLVAIDLQCSKLKQIWKGHKRLDKLRFLNLSHSLCLTKTPDFSGLKNLEELFLNDCTNLVEVDYSIGCLDKLFILNMANCRRVRKVPSSIFMLKSLRDLDLSGCSLLELGESRGLFFMFRRLLPHYQECVPISVVSLQGLSGLRHLYLSKCNFSNVSSAFGNVMSLQGLSCLPHLQRLDLSWCRLLNVPSEIGDLTSLQYLNLSGNPFSSIPSTLSNLPYLRVLAVQNCYKLKHLPLLQNNLDNLEADNCLSLESETVGTQWVGAKDMRFLNCPKLDDKNIERDIIRSFRDGSETNLFLNGGKLPLDLDFYGSGSRLSFVVPPDMGQKIRGWIIRTMFFVSIDSIIWYEVFNYTKGTNAQTSFMGDIELNHTTGESKEVMWVSCVGGLSDNGFNLEVGDVIDFIFSRYPNGSTVKKLGIRLIYEGDEEAPQLIE